MKKNETKDLKMYLIKYHLRDTPEEDFDSAFIREYTYKGAVDILMQSDRGWDIDKIISGKVYQK